VPELPEVETIRRQLSHRLTGRRIVDARAFDHDKFLPGLGAVGHTVSSVGRRGKYLLIRLEPTAADEPQRSGPGELELIVHLGMTGQLSHSRSEDHVDPYERAAWRLDDGSELVLRDVRRFGRVALVPAGDHSHSATLATMGPEPFDDAFDAELLRSRVNGSRRAIKTHLLSQRIVAGVGNIYADEALWDAGVHPAARRLTRPAATRLVESLRAVLRAGIDAGGTTLRDYRDAGGGSGSFQFQLRCYGRAGEPCERCGSLLRRTTIDARSTTWCPSCQRR